MTAAASLLIRFGPDGLVPVVIRDAESREVLMLAFMNEEALARTRATGHVHFWSRTRNALWQKGEKSGHIQRVQAMYVNCDENSLLIDVEQVGAVCHDGYPTCFYRRVEPDGSLSIIRDRWFDPVDIYGTKGGAGLAGMTRLQLGAYRYLYDHDLAAESQTSRLLRQPECRVRARVIDELDELAGALEGTHRHADRQADVALEAGQTLYWVLLLAVRSGIDWETLRPDRALDLDMARDLPADRLLVRLIRETASRWRTRTDDPDIPLAAECHATIQLTALACAAAAVEPRTLVERDLAELRGRSYLRPYFASTSER